MSKESAQYLEARLQKEKKALKDECIRYYSDLYNEKNFNDFKINLKQFLEQEADLTLEKSEAAKQTHDNKLLDYCNERCNFLQTLNNITKEESDNIILAQKCLNFPEIEYVYSQNNLTKSKVETLIALKSLKLFLTDDHSNSRKEITKFTTAFNTNKNSFTDARGLKFKDAIRIILLSIFTAFIYPTVRMGQSLHHRHTPAFWKSNDELLRAKMEKANITVAELEKLNATSSSIRK
jgi:hypothetical protein